MPSVNNVNQAQAAQKTEESSAQKGLDSLRTLRNVALGTAAAGGTALAAEAASVIALPAALPTGAITVGALVTAGAAHAALKLGEWMNSITQQTNDAMKKATGE
ncbi:hypothetical protein COW36_13970 [bacterium (Candidatus Blackallbacteria) CG17_big_fil_post_rev_8_21_14_2_50_48_46]|uniref:Uncharacterized protein n=1 Tax=bacterium (Candidatus Blackallbacteria) CG17_big_fil_post_rev_8_21_14_2_50_48_46 TaxID=2014261 RepID=A0A2M7G390_9BACT|nr:MAG: hypothetical protein COW64_23440 [bacterium (Candidatus Blackallbacteria) CG18_big_fil_WC_8_21_14_2_50_49_26]PIW16233.1 MAG: hypothetical protein COW36_13970 [bacterium (Candidatus Blackallbacteria) CG17_big_fil_post_rev_8_21_14_2_50_48_46]PIW49885.1 MAG: hypothetical protein COW20_04335 [bacterium (Candidatus Blackallbacteria) CG13_big_fil_rev_8_21_14_2_50_49_14]